MIARIGIVLAALAGLAFVQALPAVAQDKSKQNETYDYLNAFGDVFEKIRSNYVDVPDERTLIEGAIRGMLQALDEQSTYYSPGDFQRQQEQARGKFAGLGIEVTMKDGAVQVVAPLDGSPAARAGLQAGDTIKEVNGVRLDGLPLHEAVAEMRGPVGTTATLKIVRPGRAAPFEAKVVRDTIQTINVRARTEGDIGYVRIASFRGERILDQLKKAIADISKQVPADRLKGYVIDLRNNSGGPLDQALAAADAFLHRGEIVSIRSRNPDDTQRHDAQQGDLTGGKDLVVLINGGTASGAEIVASALQTHRRAQVVGTRSFGMGLIKVFMPVEQIGGGFTLATARFHTPRGRSIHEQGIDPDHIVEQDPPAKLAPGVEPPNLAAYVPADTSADKQLRFALDLLRGGVSAGAAKPETPTSSPIGADGDDLDFGDL